MEADTKWINDTVSTTPSVVSKERCRRHGKVKGKRIQWLYVASIVLWLLLIWALRLWEIGPIGWLILLVPLVVFFFGYVNAHELTVEIEDRMFEANYLSVGLIIVLPLLMWISNRSSSGTDKRYFVQVVVVALVLSMLSMIDLWVPRCHVSLVKHGKSILQTASISLLIFALYWFLDKESVETLVVTETITVNR